MQKLTPKELKEQKSFDPVTDYMFLSKDGLSVSVFNRPDKEYLGFAFNSPALKQPITNKYGSYFVTNQKIIKILILVMFVCALYLFFDPISYSENVAHSILFAFGMLLKYLAELLLVIHYGPPAFDRVFRSIENVACLLYLSAGFASMAVLQSPKSSSIGKNISIVVYVISAIVAVAMCVFQHLPYWLILCIYFSYAVCAFFVILTAIKNESAALMAVIVSLQVVGGAFTMFRGVRDGENFKAPQNQLKNGRMDRLERWWLQWRHRNWVGPYEMHFGFIAVADLCFHVLLHQAGMK